MSGKDDPSLSQHDRFLEIARALGCDENPATFDEKLKVIARHKPKDKTKQQKDPGRRQSRVG